MTVSISAVLLLGAFVFLLCRYARLPIWQAVVCVLFGYYLASSALGPIIGRSVRFFAEIIAGLSL